MASEEKKTIEIKAVKVERDSDQKEVGRVQVFAKSFKCPGDCDTLQVDHIAKLVVQF